jgi:hypothetical protein
MQRPPLAPRTTPVDLPAALAQRATWGLLYAGPGLDPGAAATLTVERCV